VSVDIQRIAQKGSALSIGVIGDLCVDAYYFLHDENAEISVETGKPTCSVEKYYFDLGGAANVALNLKRLGTGRVELFGITGEDPFGKILAEQAREAGIILQGVIVQKENWSTHVYSKIYRGGKEEPRFDMGNFNIPAEASIDALISSLKSSLHRFDAVIINEQTSRTFHSSSFQEKLIPLINSSGEKPRWFCDCRNLNDIYTNTIHKLNDREALALYNRCHPQNPLSLSAGVLTAIIVWLYERWGKPVIITRGADGAVAFDGAVHETPGLHLINRIDPVGAGDAFLAALCFGSAAGLSWDEALELGNFSAGVSVQKLFQTGHPVVEEIAAIAEAPDYRHNPWLADNPQRAVYIEGTDIEIISKPASPLPRIVIFDHDGTISTLRLGWENVMEETMIRCILEDAASSVSAAQYREVQKAVVDFISRTTGIQTLIQMEGLEKMVRDFGYVPSEAVLDPHGYKRIYNDKLLRMVEKKTRLIQSGKLSPEDCTIKGAIPFLGRLRKAGVTLYLASGTDAEDVRREAALLGYGSLFAKIYGSVGDITRDPKRVVFETIMAEIGPAGTGSCAVFGDGPVELREARRNGAAAIGLLSDEVQRFGINPEKRSRLVLAGADVLIPDFSWADELFAWLGWRV
jgi:bifunctional ADP-heptose synthase (sugar kinase/adenylyltransferase)/phosphoglycolate phosphatase-like HAD superfamily hydrolase